MVYPHYPRWYPACTWRSCRSGPRDKVPQSPAESIHSLHFRLQPLSWFCKWQLRPPLICQKAAATRFLRGLLFLICPFFSWFVLNRETKFGHTRHAKKLLRYRAENQRWSMRDKINIRERPAALYDLLINKPRCDAGLFWFQLFLKHPECCKRFCTHLPEVSTTPRCLWVFCFLLVQDPELIYRLHSQGFDHLARQFSISFSTFRETWILYSPVAL